MPHKNPEKRRENARAWRKAKHTPNYMRWLGARRALHREIEEDHEAALLIIARTILSIEGAQVLAENALLGAQRKREQLGNRFDHEKDEPYWKEPT
jgi:hypothetical protein